MNRLSIGTKLMLLAGVPVVGALVLAALIAQGARTQATAAAALGSIEDVAQLSVRIGTALGTLQLERARAALAEGASTGSSDPLTPPPSGPAVQAPARRALFAGRLAAQYKVTDGALRDLQRFLAGRDLSKLPARLARDLGAATARMAALPGFRQHLQTNEVPIEEILGFYGGADDALISAVAALTQLSDDGELLRRISSLVALAELTERGSLQHALLSFIFASGEFPPGTFKTLVTLATEQAVYETSFRDFATEERFALYAQGQRAPDSQFAIQLRNDVITATDDSVSIDAGTWFDKEAARLDRLADVESSIIDRVSSAAALKMATTRASIRTSIGLSFGVVVASTLLAWLIARGITRNIGMLSSAAARVQKTKDFSVRAQVTSSDELGTLTAVFNEMLAGIQTRDGELSAHRSNLEGLVASRTAELVARGGAMRLVLDNVEKGLATVLVGGALANERSRALDAWFGVPEEGKSFAAHLAGGDEALRFAFESAWEQVVEDVLPLELNIEQMPKRIDRDGRHFTVQFKPILQEGKLEGALLVVSDVTDELEARADHERQSEYIAVFERAANDREGFITFAIDTTRQLTSLAEGTLDPIETMRALHTLKGNTAQWGVASVARLAHAIESGLLEAQETPDVAAFQSLLASWMAVTDRFRAVLVRDANAKVELTQTEIDRLLGDVRSRVSHEELALRIEALKQEPTSVRFERMKGDVERLAKRLGKPCPAVIVEHGDVRLPTSRFDPFWSSAVHLLRNMLDHGIESPAVRRKAGKPEVGTLTFRSSSAPDHYRLEFSDDGRGIDWDKVRASVADERRSTITQANLEELLLAGGISTASAVTEVSGRGIGLSDVARRCEDLGGSLSLESVRGSGTKFVCIFPKRENGNSLAPPTRGRAVRLSAGPAGAE